MSRVIGGSVMLATPVAICLVGLLVPLKFGVVSWLVILGFLAAFIFAAGYMINGRALGCLIDGRNQMSLSRLQLIVWTILIISAYAAEVLIRIQEGQTDPLAVSIPELLWAVLGISTTSFVGSPLIRNSKKENDVPPDRQQEKDRTIQRLIGEDGLQPNPAQQAQAAAQQAQAATQRAQVAEQQAQAAAQLAPAAAAQQAQAAEQQAQAAAQQAQAAEQQAQIAAQLAQAAQQDQQDQVAAQRAQEAQAAEQQTQIAAQQAQIAAQQAQAAAAQLVPAVAQQAQAAVVQQAQTSAQQAQAATQPVSNIGQIIVKSDPKQARLADMFKGDEISDGAQLDLGKIQLFYFTLVLVLAYGVQLGNLFLAGAVFSDMPELPLSMVALLGISHAGYLGNKATPG